MFLYIDDEVECNTPTDMVSYVLNVLANSEAPSCKKLLGFWGNSQAGEDWANVVREAIKLEADNAVRYLLQCQEKMNRFFDTEEGRESLRSSEGRRRGEAGIYIRAQGRTPLESMHF